MQISPFWRTRAWLPRVVTTNDTPPHIPVKTMFFYANISFVYILHAQVRKIKAIYHTMNMFNLDVTHKCLIAECWCPVSDLDQIQDALKRGTVRIV